MGLFFESDFHDEFGSWPLAYVPYGGADVGEVIAVGKAVGNGDDSAYYEAWVAAGDRLFQEAETALANGHKTSAEDLFLRASVFYGAAYHPIYGAPVDPRLITAFRKQTAAFDAGLALQTPPVSLVGIPFEGASMPAYLLPAIGHATEVRPLLILTNGYDGTITDMYFASAVAASRRGYHCLMFDGPGQGAMLYEQGIPMRPDWETVVAAVVDFALTLPIVDPQRIALSGWSLGGYLAPRAASGEPRIAALVADPGQWGIAAGFRDAAVKLGASPQQVASFADIDQGLLDRMERMVMEDRKRRWSVVQRGYWVHGVDNFRDFLRAAEPYSLDGRAELIRCPTLITAAEQDSLSSSAQFLYDQLCCEKTLIKFTAAEGAGGHCEMANRSVLNRRVLDWLDEQFEV
jgi:pimeloyl-ACP methyl ester carboxylesterase